MNEIEIVEYLETLFNTSAISSNVISDNMLEVYIDGLGTFEITVKQIKD